MNLSEAHDFFETIAELQKDSCILAMRQSGLYKIAKHFRRHIYTESVWNKMGHCDRKKKIKSFLNAKLGKALTEPNVTNAYRRQKTFSKKGSKIKQISKKKGKKIKQTKNKKKIKEEKDN